jgi:cytochrome c-type biogenesis protein CcmH
VKRLLVFVFCMMLPFASLAIDTGKAFDDPELQARYDKLISEVRCLKCQNQTIKDSRAFLADDLKREIKRMLSEGKTDEEILDFLVLRYGEFALYRPLMSGKTLILWIAPGLLILGGIAVAVNIVRSRMKMPIDDDPDGAET